MSALPTIQKDAATLLRLLAEVDRVSREFYPDLTFSLHGFLDGQEVMRLPCPRPPSLPPEPREDTNAANIMQAVNEADGPQTCKELYGAVTGITGEPTGAFKRAVRQLVVSGRLRELAGPPRAFDLP